MTGAVRSLEAGFGQAIKRYGKAIRSAPCDPWWRGPVSIRPMIEFRPVMDAGEAMRVIPDDYDDPERWWL